MTNRLNQSGISGKLLLQTAVLVFTISLVACKPKMQPTEGVTHTASNMVQGKPYYTCSMHPHIHEDHPGDCPVCGMKLIKVEVTDQGGNKQMGKIRLTAAQIELGGIQTDTVREQNVGNEKTLTGTVTANETQSEDVSSRISGRIQHLFVRTVGEKIGTGQPLYTVYSEDIQEAEKELLLASQQQKILHSADVDYKQLLVAAENKLLLWGITKSQIKSLLVSGKVSPSVTILSKTSGTVSDLLVHEGDYVTEGMAILKTQGLNNLWVEAQLYASETSYYKDNDRVTVGFPELNEPLINGKVQFINPELSDATKLNLMRVSILNPKGLIRPGMLAYVSISSGSNKSLAVPVSAILLDEKGSKVWIKNGDGSFSSKVIKVGDNNQNYVSITSGLTKGDIIVTKGAYLLSGEAYFKGDGNEMKMGDSKMDPNMKM